MDILACLGGDSHSGFVYCTVTFNPLLNEAHRKQFEESDAGWQFSHSLTEQIGGQLRAGFTLTGIYEDTNGEGRLHELHIPSFIATRAVK